MSRRHSLTPVQRLALLLLGQGPIFDEPTDPASARLRSLAPLESLARKGLAARDRGAPDVRDWCFTITEAGRAELARGYYCPVCRRHVGDRLFRALTQGATCTEAERKAEREARKQKVVASNARARARRKLRQGRAAELTPLESRSLAAVLPE